MDPRETEFFQRLCAPFPASSVKVYSQGGKTMHYVGRAVLMNRLDDVVGPSRWSAEYREAREKGYVCALTIAVPEGNAECRDVTKEDGGGVSEMKDGGDAEKSRFTSAFERACEAWGIG